MLQRKRKILATLLLVVFALYYANISFFYHSHTFNGHIVSHSHFHGSNHAKTGTHTAAEFSLIAAVSNFQSLQTSAGVVDLVLLVCLAILYMGAECKVISAIPATSYLRGPPAFV